MRDHESHEKDERRSNGEDLRTHLLKDSDAIRNSLTFVMFREFRGLYFRIQSEASSSPERFGEALASKVLRSGNEWCRAPSLSVKGMERNQRNPSRKHASKPQGQPELQVCEEALCGTGSAGALGGCNGSGDLNVYP